MAAEWSRFRGPNGTGVSDAKDLPLEYGPNKNVVWKTELAGGYSSPVIGGDKIFVTAFEKDDLYTIAIDRLSGKILWKQLAPRERSLTKYGVNTPVSPTPATDGAKRLRVLRNGRARLVRTRWQPAMESAAWTVLASLRIWIVTDCRG